MGYKTPDLIIYRKTHTFSDGQSIRVTATGFTPQECIANMKIKINDTEGEIKRKNVEKSESKNITLAESMEQWLVQTKKDAIKDKTYDRYETTIQNQIAKYSIGNIESYAVNEKDIKLYIQELMKSDLSYSSIKKAYGLLKQFMSYLYEKNISLNPMNTIKLPKSKRGSIDLSENVSDEELENLVDTGYKPITIRDILSDEEIKIFKKESCREYKFGISGYRYGRIIYFMILTFPRMGEMLAARWKDIDFVNKKMKIDKAIATVKNRDDGAEKKTKRIITSAKYDRIRDVMLTDEAIEVLNEHKKLMDPKSDDEFICKTIHGTVVNERVLYDSLKLILTRAGIDKESFSPHNLRHTGISYYIRHGVPIDVIANMAGHDVSVTQKVYYHIIQDQKEKTLDIMNSIQI